MSSGLVRAGHDIWRVDAMIFRETAEGGTIRVGDWDFPFKVIIEGGSRVCKLHRTQGVRWTETTVEELEAMLQEVLSMQ
jgi:hypothetical protein